MPALGMYIHSVLMDLGDCSADGHCYSRSDAFFGNNHVFNQTVFDYTKAWWTAETLTPMMLANSKLARQLQSRADNPEYRFTESVEEFSLGEVTAPVIAFGDLATGEVPRALVEYFFGPYITIHTYMVLYSMPCRHIPAQALILTRLQKTSASPPPWAGTRRTRPFN